MARWQFLQVFSSGDEWLALEDFYQFRPIELHPYNLARYARYTISIPQTLSTQILPSLKLT